jgi:dTMP kinase
MFITFEGVEGSGKSTQIGFLKDSLENLGYQVLLTREPGGSILGNKIRQLILDPAQEDKPGDITELLLYIADRAHHVSTVIAPALKANTVVLCDRYTDSTVAYQGYARGFKPELVENLNQIATGGLTPNLTIIMDLEPETGLERVKKSRNQQVFDRLEAEKIEFYRKVREGFLAISRKEPGRVKVLDASQSPDEVREQVLSLVNNLFGR